jgi:hypothetical protein
MEDRPTDIDGTRVPIHELALDLQTCCRCFTKQNCTFHDQDTLLSATVPTVHQTSKTLNPLIGQCQRKGHQ